MGHRYKLLTLFSEGRWAQSQFHSMWISASCCISLNLYQQQMFSTGFNFIL